MEGLDWDTVVHPPYSSDIALSDCHLHGPLKAFLAEKKSTEVEDVVRAVSDFFAPQSTRFWEKGVAELPIRWDTVVSINGDYIVE